MGKELREVKCNKHDGCTECRAELMKNSSEGERSCFLGGKCIDTTACSVDWPTYGRRSVRGYQNMFNKVAAFPSG